MRQIYSLIFSILFFAILFGKSLQSAQLNTNHDINEKNTPYELKKSKDIQNHLNSFDLQNDQIKHLINNQLRNKRSYGNDILDTIDDFDEQQQILPSTVIQNNDANTIPPWVMILLAQKIKQQREREERTRIKTPRLGRDLEDEIDCQRSRPPFSPRLGKKSVPFKPRLGRSYFDDIKY